MITQLLVPTAVLMILAFAVTRLVECAVPESLRGLAGLAVVSGLICWGMASAGFAGLYLSQDRRIFDLFETAPSASLGYFLRLGANAALIWGPIVLLTVSTAPRRWKTSVW